MKKDYKTPHITLLQPLTEEDDVILASLGIEYDDIWGSDNDLC